MKMIGKVFKALRRVLAIHSEIEKAKQKGKPWYKSKTIWVNLIALIAILASFKGIEITPEEQAQIVAGILAVVNILLRFITHEPVYVSKKLEEETEE